MQAGGRRGRKLGPPVLEAHPPPLRRRDVGGVPWLRRGCGGPPRRAAPDVGGRHPVPGDAGQARGQRLSATARLRHPGGPLDAVLPPPPYRGHRPPPDTARRGGLGGVGRRSPGPGAREGGGHRPPSGHGVRDRAPGARHGRPQALQGPVRLESPRGGCRPRPAAAVGHARPHARGDGQPGGGGLGVRDAGGVRRAIGPRGDGAASLVMPEPQIQAMVVALVEGVPAARRLVDEARAARGPRLS